VRNTVPETPSKVAIRGLALLLLLAHSPAHADEAACPATDSARQGRTPAPAPTAKVDPSTTPTTIDGDQVEYKVNGNMVLSGNVVMKQGDREIRADHLELNPNDRSAKMEGGVEYSDSRLIVRGNSGTYSPTLGANFEGTEFELPEHGARGAARSLSVDANGKVTLDDVNFTTCPAEDVAWQMDAHQIELDTQGRNGTGHGTKVEFKGIPIVYLPWMTFPIGPDRKSGFLFPNIGASSRNGAQFEMPYYWNIRPNLDFTAQPVYYSKRGVDLGGELRYLTSRQRGSFEFNYLPNDNEADRDRYHFVLNHVAELPGEWRFRIDATDVSDTNYFEDFAQGPEGTSVAFAERLAEVTYRDEHLNLRGQVQDFQTIDDELRRDERPYTRAPRLLASGDWDTGGGTIDYGFDAELVDFERNVDQLTLDQFPDAGVTGWRLDVAPHIGFDWSAPGYFVRPTIGYRYTQYSLTNRAPGDDDTPTRSLPFAALDAGMYFERSSGSQGQRLLTLEPRALYLYTPYRNQDQLPLFDTGVPDLNLVQLYRTNRFVGADRVNDADQIAVGLTSRLLNSSSGAQYLAISVGQAYYFEKPRVVLPGEPPATRNTSDFIGQVSLTAYKNWNVEAGMQWNPEDQETERSQFRIQYRPDGEHVVNLAYRKQRDITEQVDASTAWPIGTRWNAFARYVYSLFDSKTLDEFAGFEFKACCYRIRGVARRSVSSRDGKSETGVYIQLELNGLASVGTSADAFLERTIRGYSRETPVPGKPSQ
jgi:LPS-assembly protein